MIEKQEVTNKQMIITGIVFALVCLMAFLLGW